MMTPFLYPLASLSQIQQTPSQTDGIPKDVEDDLRICGCKLIQEAGVLLKQNQVAMSTAQVIFHRFWYVTSMKQFSIGDIGMGALYLASKLEECPVMMRDLINIYSLLIARSKHLSSSRASAFTYKPMSYHSPRFYDIKESLVIAEMQILKRLAFQVQVVLPYGTLVSYLQVLELASREDVCKRGWGYLNDAFQTPVYALFPISTIICASILLCARFFSIPLPEKWYEVFDAEWEDMWSVAGYIMRLYQPQSLERKRELMVLLDKKALRQWLEDTKTSSTANLR